MPTGGGPSETTKLTGAPGAADDPPAGFWLSTDPCAIDALCLDVIPPVVRLAATIDVSAAACG